MPSKGGKSRIEKQDGWRDSIQTGAILKKYKDQALANFESQFDEKGTLVPGGKRGTIYDHKTGEVVRSGIVPMTSTQVRIADSLLARTLPVIKIVEQDINVTGHIKMAMIAPDEMDPEEWQKRYGKK